jgi:hypothetical protein
MPQIELQLSGSWSTSWDTKSELDVKLIVNLTSNLCPNLIPNSLLDFQLPIAGYPARRMQGFFASPGSPAKQE